MADPTPQLLILDEPTNNLDMSSVNWLLGAPLVVSHDENFCRRLGLDRELFLA